MFTLMRIKEAVFSSPLLNQMGLLDRNNEKRLLIGASIHRRDCFFWDLVLPDLVLWWSVRHTHFVWKFNKWWVDTGTLSGGARESLDVRQLISYAFSPHNNSITQSEVVRVWQSTSSFLDRNYAHVSKGPLCFCSHISPTSILPTTESVFGI